MGAERPTCVIVGSLNLDLVLDLPVLPRRGETVAGGRFHSGPGGKGANQAAIAAGLGAKVYLVGRVGRDEAGAAARADLRAAGVDDTYLSEDPVEPTGTALVLVGEGGENLIGLAAGANAGLSAELVGRAIAEIAADTPWAVLLVSLEVPLEAVAAACSAARAHGWTVVLNPAPGRPLPDELVGQVDVITPNIVELQQVSTDGVAGLLVGGSRSVIVTKGSGGAEVWQDPHEPTLVPAFKVEVTDTTGCGDAFSGTLSWALADGHPLIDAVRLACAAGALTATVAGARVRLTREELDRLATT